MRIILLFFLLMFQPLFGMKADWDKLIKAIETDVSSNKLSVVQSIVPFKIKVSATTFGKKTPLSMAIFHNKFEIACYLARELNKEENAYNTLNDQKQFTSIGPVNFYEKQAPFYEFTNFYYAPIMIDHKLWPTTEHYFQAQKFTDQQIQEEIRLSLTPRNAFDLANKTYKNKVRSDWKTVNVDVMQKVLPYKFKQHENLKQLLLKTNNRTIVEHTKNDTFWGDGGDGSGKNMLGKLLMEVRATLQVPVSSATAPLQKSLESLKNNLEKLQKALI